MKILIIRFSSIGDVLLTFHVIHALKEKHPDSDIHVLTKPAFVPLFRMLPVPVNIIPLTKSMIKTASILRRERFELIIDLHNNLRSRFLQVLLFNHSWRNVQKLNVRKWLLTTFKWNTLPQIHVVDRYLKTAGLASSGINPLTLNVPEGVRLPTDKPYIAWVLGAKFKTKQFPIVKIMELLPSIKYPIVFLGGTSEVDEAKKLPANHSIFNWVNKTTLDEAAFVLKNASMVVSNDTGLMHLAAFFNKPMLVLWGSTSEAFGMGPYRCARVVHAEIQSLSCRPCSKIGYKQCPKGHFKCMMLHPSQRLASQINSLFLEGTEAPR